LAASMSWTKLLGEKRVAPEPTSKKELDELRTMANSNLKDAHIGAVSAQGRYEFAYNAARLMATTVVRVVAKNGHHYFTFQALQAADPAFAPMALYFDRARDTRTISHTTAHLPSAIRMPRTWSLRSRSLSSMWSVGFLPSIQPWANRNAEQRSMRRGGRQPARLACRSGRRWWTRQDGRVLRCYVNGARDASGNSFILPDVGR
jgi:hypothetical protein